MKKISNRKILIWVVAVVLILTLVVGGCAIYVSDYYRADVDAIAAFAAESDVRKNELSDGTLVYGEEDAEVGFIFYPGGKVEYTAYEPLMRQIAAGGVLCVLVEMPFHLAVLDVNAADGVQELYDHIDRWYIGGHSLGGSMAASYLDKHTEDFEGLVLLGSYSTADISGDFLDVLSVFGSEDKVMNQKKYQQYKANLPRDLTEIEIEGGCHAYFGMYGEQVGDGIPAISHREQICQTARHILHFFAKGGD